MYINRDMNINHIKTRYSGLCSGMGLGIMVLDMHYPGFPGDIRNPSSYPFPIQYEIIDGLDLNPLRYLDHEEKFLPLMIAAAKKLEKLGCRAIAAEGSYFGNYQKDIADAVNIPVFTSSLLQLPFIQPTISSKKKAVILTPLKERMTEEYLSNFGIQPRSNYIAESIHDHVKCTEFIKLWGAPGIEAEGTIEFEAARDQMVTRALKIKEEHPDMGALIFDCTGWTPYSRAIQQAIDVPVYSWGTLLDSINLAVNNREYYGNV